jgi:hypothetical protein
MSFTMPTLAEIQAHILGKAAKDSAFRQALLADSKATIQQEFASKYPGFPQLRTSLDIKVVEQSKDKVYLVLPPVAAAVGELDNEELKRVSGGSDTTCGSNPFVSWAGGSGGDHPDWFP